VNETCEGQLLHVGQLGRAVRNPMNDTNKMIMTHCLAAPEITYDDGRDVDVGRATRKGEVYNSVEE